MTWIQQQQEQIAKGKAAAYVHALANGEAEMDKGRYEACVFLLNKVWPNPPQTAISVESDRIPDFAIIQGQD